MDLQKTWQNINQRVDWLLAGIIALIIGTLGVGGFSLYFYLTAEDPLEKHGLQTVAEFEIDEEVLEELPDLDEIEIEPPPEAEELPERFVELKGTDLFLPLTARRIPDEFLVEPPGVDPDDPDAPEDPEPRLPPIDGFEITGRIVGDEEEIKIGFLKRREDNRMFIAREGEYLKGTEIRVENISDTAIQLAKPEHEETEFQFDIDRMSQQIKDQILWH